LLNEFAVTDSNKSKRPVRRKDASREPPTIDLKATEVDEAADPGVREGPEPAAAGPDAVAAGPTETVGPEPAPSVPPPEGEAAAGPAAEPEIPPADHPPGGAAEEPVPPPGRDERRSAGFGTVLAASLLGGLVGAGAVAAFQVWQAPETAADPRIAQLQQQVAGLSGPANLQPLEERLAALSSAQQELNQRVQAVQQTAEQGAARAEEALNRPAPETAAPAASENSQAIAELQNRLGSLENRLQEREQAATGELAALRQEIEGVRQQLGQTASSVQQLGQVASNVQQMTDRLSALQQQIAQTAESAQAQRGQLEQRLGGQEQRLTELSNQVARGGSDVTRAGIRVVLAERLSRALSQGTPYAEVLAALRELDADQARLAALEPFAQEGAPTAAALARQFEPLGDTIIRQSRSGDSWGDRFLRMADQVVSVRPVDAPGATDAPSLVARIESALEEGRLQDALSAWEALPEPARQDSQDFGQQLQRRAAADESARAIAADAVSALNSATR
jgi:predicted  nucleic acid-binding Zn-ribbon protein